MKICRHQHTPRIIALQKNRSLISSRTLWTAPKPREQDREGPPNIIIKGMNAVLNILDERCSVIGELHDISDRVDRSAPVLDNPGVIVEKSAENIDDLNKECSKVG